MGRLYSRPKRRRSKLGQPPPEKERSTTCTVSTMASLNSRPKRSTKVDHHQKKMNSSSRTRSFSLLPDEIVLNCLARISKSQYRSLSLVCKTFRSILSSPDLYTVRSQIGNTEPCICIRQALPTHDRWYVLDQTLITTTTTNNVNNDEFNLLPITTSSSPSKSTNTLAVGFEIYQMGGDELPSSAVRVLDFRTRTWRDAPDMSVPRKRPESALIDDKIYVVGGGTEESFSSSWPEVFDLKSQTWNLLPSLNDDDEDAEVQLCRGELFATTSTHKKYAFDFKQGTWKERQGFSDNRKRKTGPWCVIENVKFSVFLGTLMWYDDSERENWFIVKGLEDVYPKTHANYPSTLQLVNYGGGSILVVWDEPYSLELPVVGKTRKHVCKNRRFWCAVIKLEKRFFGLELEIWGEVVRSYPVLTVPKSCKLLRCITL